MGTRVGKIRLGAFIPGSAAGNASWRLPDSRPEDALNLKLYCRMAQKLEAGCFDTLFLNDSVGVNVSDPAVLARAAQAQRWDPLTLLPALAMVTSRIGLTATANTSYNEPYTLARRLASLDMVSAGRAGWNCVTSLGGGENYNRDDHMLHAERYERAEEFVDVIRGLWDSWEDDAAIRDKESGLWFDIARLHTLNHRGRFFTVRGPLNAPRPPQGYPVIAQAGASEAGRALAGRTGEMIFTAAQTVEEGREFIEDITARAAAHGRPRDSFVVMPGVSVVTAATTAEAQAKYDRLHGLRDTTAALKRLSTFASLGVDLSEYPIDGPAPLPDEVPLANTHQSRQKLVRDLIRRERPTIRQLLRMMSAGGHRLLIGTPAEIADNFALWFEAGAADGFNIMFQHMPDNVDDFVDLVVPELQRRGMFRTEYAGTTLREHLGLSRPAHPAAGRLAAE